MTKTLDVDALCVLDIGSLDVNGSPRRLFGHAHYVGIDRQAGKGVDIVTDARDFDGDGCFDVVLSCEAMEHEPEPQVIVDCAWRALHKGGALLLTVAAPGRRPHGPSGSGLVRGDYYGAITRAQMEAMLSKWEDVAMYDNAQHGDLYAVARRP